MIGLAERKTESDGDVGHVGHRDRKIHAAAPGSVPNLLDSEAILEPIRSRRVGWAAKVVEGLLESVDIQIDGSRPWDIQIHDPRFYRRVLLHGSLGLGESYMDGWWDCEALDQLFARVLAVGVVRPGHYRVRSALSALGGRIVHPRRRTESAGHYDLGTDLFVAMLDRRLTYTSGYWRTATTLDEAQEAKLELVCTKLGLRPGMTVLDIGCGWGSFVQYAAERYGVRVTGVALSPSQVEVARQRCAGLPVTVLRQDYRDIEGQFDRVVSLGMFEHVGHTNYRAYMKVVHRVLADDGLFLLHTIGGNHSVHRTDAWLGTYIFPNAMLPSIRQIGAAIEDLFVMEDWHNFGADYDTTLMAWYANVQSHRESLKQRFDDRFYRMWTYYLLSCAGSFRARRNQLWQVVLSKNGVAKGYEAPR